MATVSKLRKSAEYCTGNPAGNTAAGISVAADTLAANAANAANAAIGVRKCATSPALNDLLVDA